MRIKNVVLTLKMPKKFDFLMQFAVLILILFGTLMIVSTNVGNTTKDPYIIPKVLAKQLFFIIVSYVLMTFFANNFTMKRAQKLFPVFGIGIIIALFSTQLFEGVLGSKAWIRIPIPGLGEMTIQPSEFAKVYMVVVMAVFVELTARRRKFKFWTIVRIPVYFFMVIVAAILLQKDLGTLFVLVLLCAICFLIPSHISLRKQQRWVRLGLIIGCISIVFIMSEPVIDFLNGIGPLQHVAVRIENALNPFTDPHNNGYQLINGLYGFARSGFTVVVLGYVVILQRLFYYAFHTKSEGYKVILVGTAMYIFIHFALNVGGVSGLIPLTGVPLLFISSGGSSLMSIMTAIGISQSVISRIRRQGSVAVSAAAKQLPHT